MKVAFLTPVFWPYNGGIGRVAANEAISLKKAGCEVNVFTPHYNKNWLKEEIWQDIAISRLNYNWKIGNAAGIKIKISDLDSFDLVHLHYPFIGGVGSILKWKKQTRKPLVVTYHMDLVATGIRGFLFKVYSWFVLPKIVAAADKIIFSSLDYGKHSFLSKYLKKESEKFTAVPFGVEIKNSSLSKIEVKKQLGLENEGKIILFVGGLDKAHYFKGLEVLFKSLAQIKQIKFKAVIVGDGELKDYYQKQANQMGVMDKIKFVGKVSEEDLQKYYQASDVLILPSISPSEAYGMVLIEASAQGLPIIASDLPGVREQVGENRGRLFKVGDNNALAQQILNILTNSELAEKMGVNGKEWVKNNRSLQQEAEKLSTVYKFVVDK